MREITGSLMFAFADPAGRTHRIWLGGALAPIVLYFMLIVPLAPGARFREDIHISASVAEWLDTGAIQAMTPRYHVNSCLIFSSCVLMLVTGKERSRLGEMTRQYLPLLAFAGLAYVAVSTLTLLRMHSLYIERTRGAPVAISLPASHPA